VARRTEAFAQAYIDYRNLNTVASRKSKVTSAAEIISPASVPAFPSGPDHMLQIGAALLLSLALGISVAAANDRWGRHVRGPGHLAELTRSAVLAVVPRPKLSGPERLVVAARPRSEVAEAYRILQTKVFDPMVPPHVSTLLVTCASDRDREARDVVTANLAAAAAEVGRAVVIVAEEADRGVLEGLLGVRHTGVDISYEVLDTPAPVSGTPRPEDAEGRTTSWWTAEELSAGLGPLEHFRQAYDVVIVQAAPLRSSARTLMRLRQCDACLLVADTALSSRDDIQEAHREATLGSFGPVMTVLTEPCSAWLWRVRGGTGSRGASKVSQPQRSSADHSARRKTHA